MTDETPTIDPERAVLLVMDYQPTILANVAGADELLTRTTGAIANRAAPGSSSRIRAGRVRRLRLRGHPRGEQVVLGVGRGWWVSGRQPAGGGRRAGGARTRRHRRAQDARRRVFDHRSRPAAPQRDINTLILAGIATSGVVLSTVRDAADRDYRIFVLSDGCADRDDEVHAVLTQKVFPRQAWVITIAELAGRLG